MNTLTPWMGSLLTAGLLVGCGQAKPKDYAGPALFTVQGTITSEGPVSGEIKLALVWDERSALGFEAGLESQEVPFEGTFPLSYQMNLTAPPPETVLSEPFHEAAEPTPPGHVAQAVLVAYQDTNGNGVLDVIPPGDTPIDTLLGSSLTSGARPSLLVYSDQDGQRLESAPWVWNTPWGGALSLPPVSIPKGYSILSYDIDPSSGLPTGTESAQAMDVALTPSAFNNMVVCDGAYLWDADGSLNQGEDDVRNQHLCRCDRPTRLELVGRLAYPDPAGLSGTAIQLWACPNPEAGDAQSAQVAVNGHPLEVGPGGYFSAPAGQDWTQILEPGENEVTGTWAGYDDASVSLHFGVPTITRPVDGSEITAGAPVELAWDAPHGAQVVTGAYAVFVDQVPQATLEGDGLTTQYPVDGALMNAGAHAFAVRASETAASETGRLQIEATAQVGVTVP